MIPAIKFLKETLKEISKDLKQGEDSEAAFMKHKNIFGYFTAFMLGLASKSGNMAEVYRATAKFLERRHEFKRSLRSALITPLVTVLVLNAAVVWYVAYIFPATAELFLRYNMKLPPMTQFTLDMSYWLSANIWYHHSCISYSNNSRNIVLSGIHEEESGLISNY